ncbi:MAG TPA: phosphatase PAP2 family protein [Galbitalea sp.]|jgi:undecaprenyl-diphosphatase
MRFQVRRVWVWIAVAGLAAFTALAIDVSVFHRTSPFALDRAVNSWIVGGRVGALVSVSKFMATIGAGTLGDLIIPGVVAIAFVIARRWRAAVILVVVMAVSSALVQLLKTVIHRARPPHGLVHEASWSFPSGHATQAGTLVVVLMLLLRWRWFVIAGSPYALAMAASRVYLGVHWTTDVVAGLVLGGSVGLLGVGALDRALQRLDTWMSSRVAA